LTNGRYVLSVGRGLDAEGDTESSI